MLIYGVGTGINRKCCIERELFERVLKSVSKKIQKKITKLKNNLYFCVSNFQHLI
jgi:hypothetical protein